MSSEEGRRTERVQPLSDERLNSVITLFGVFFLGGVTVMTLGSTPLFWLGLLLMLLGISGSWWRFKDDWFALIHSPHTRDASVTFLIAAVVTALECIIAVFMICSYWPSAIPLKVSGSVGPGNYPEKLSVYGISWIPEMYAELRVSLENPTDYDYSSLYVVLTSELPMAEVVQTTNIQDCLVEPDIDFSKWGHMNDQLVPKLWTVTIPGNDGKNYILPMPLDEPWPKHLKTMLYKVPYKITCSMLPRHSTLEILAAVMNPVPGQDNHPRPPHWAVVDSSYEVGSRLRAKRTTLGCGTNECEPITSNFHYDFMALLFFALLVGIGRRVAWISSARGIYVA